MKKYIKPTINIVKIGTIGMLASSGDPLSVGIRSNETIDDITFGAPDFDFDDEFFDE